MFSNIRSINAYLQYFRFIGSSLFSHNQGTSHGKMAWPKGHGKTNLNDVLQGKLIQKSVVLWRFCPVSCFLLFPILELLTPKGSLKKVTFWVTPRLSIWCSHFFSLNFAPDIWWRQWFWWYRAVGVCKAIVSFCKQIVNVGDQNGGNRRFKVVKNTFRLQYPLPTSI